LKDFEKMEEFSFVTPVTGLNRHNTGNQDDDDDDEIIIQIPDEKQWTAGRGY
jgi:hypothetical protein